MKLCCFQLQPAPLQHGSAASPPTPKWERETIDQAVSSTSGTSGGGGGDSSSEPSGFGQQLKVPPNSWGLNATALEEVGRCAAVRALLARIGALYPEFHVRTMPADALEPDGVPGATSSMVRAKQVDPGISQ